jgi:hypothetical protein
MHTVIVILMCTEAAARLLLTAHVHLWSHVDAQFMQHIDFLHPWLVQIQKVQLLLFVVPAFF